MNERNDILSNFVEDVNNRKKQQSSNKKKNNLSSNQQEKEEENENHHHQILVCSDLGSRGLDFSSDIQVSLTFFNVFSIFSFIFSSSFFILYFFFLMI